MKIKYRNYNNASGVVAKRRNKCKCGQQHKDYVHADLGLERFGKGAAHCYSRKMSLAVFYLCNDNYPVGCYIKDLVILEPFFSP